MNKPQKPGLKKNFKKTIGVIGIGYVGLPLIINLSKYFNVIAYDKNNLRIIELKKGVDKNKEFTSKELKRKRILYTNNYEKLNSCNVFILTLPTPINKKKYQIFQLY